MKYNEHYDKAVKDGNTTQISSLIYKFKEIGETVVGKLIEIGVYTFKATDDMKESTAGVYFFDTDEGRIQTVLGTGADKQSGDKFIIGNVYAITFKGKIDISSGKTVNTYDILDCGKADDDGKSKK